jgi:hypothetical protein
MEGFTPIQSTAGGVLIGLAAVALLYLNGRIAGTGRRDHPSGHQYASQPTATMEEQRRANPFGCGSFKTTPGIQRSDS